MVGLSSFGGSAGAENFRHEHNGAKHLHYSNMKSLYSLITTHNIPFRIDRQLFDTISSSSYQYQIKAERDYLATGPPLYW